MRYNTDTTDFRERMDRFASRGTIWGGKGRLAYKALVAEVNKLREEAFAEGMKVALDQVAAINTNQLFKLHSEITELKKDINKAENNKNSPISPAILDIIRSQSKGE